MANSVAIEETAHYVSSIEIDHEIFPSVILKLSLIQEGQLLVSGGRMCTSTG